VLVCRAQLDFLRIASSRAKPSDAELGQLLTPTSQKIQSIQDYREKNRASPLFNHLSAVSESISALGWVAVVSLLSIRSTLRPLSRMEKSIRKVS